jgi:hypothetical protein
MSSYGNEPPFQPQNQPFGSPPGGAPPPPPPYAPAQPTYGTPAYGAPGGYSNVNPYDSRATTIMVLGILGLVICGVLGIVAWVMGSNLKKEAEAAGYPEPGQAKAGRICGIIASCFMIAGALFVLALVVIGATSGTQ